MLPNWCSASSGAVSSDSQPGYIAPCSPISHAIAHGILSCIEKWSLQFQRFRELFTSDAGELHTAVGELQH